MIVESKDGRLFNLVGEEPYRRKDGTMTMLRLWSSECVVCGDVFVVKTPGSVTSADQSQSFCMKHCDAHKLTPQEVLARMTIASKAKRAAERGLVTK